MAGSFREAFGRALQETQRAVQARSVAKDTDTAATLHSRLGDQQGATAEDRVQRKQQTNDVSFKNLRKTPHPAHDPSGLRDPGSEDTQVRYRGRTRPLSAESIPEAEEHSAQQIPTAKSERQPELSGIRCRLSVAEDPAIPPSTVMEQSGQRTQVDQATVQGDSEVVLGIDLGTSTVKVVIGDSEARKAYAVPFVDADRIMRYLLPAQVFEKDGIFSLAAGEVRHHNLKMSYLTGPGNGETSVLMVALLALVIRRARGWLLVRHADTFRQSRLLWRLNLGAPTQYTKNLTRDEGILHLCEAAWLLATSSRPVTREAIAELMSGPLPNLTDEDAAEVSVLPEIAAQIYGYVVSSSFDTRSDNIYLMADVGSGTLDAALFHVKPKQGGGWSFHFYKQDIERHGVMSLHEHRVDWWKQLLQRMGAEDETVQELEQTRHAVTRNTWVPDSYVDYFENVSLPAGDNPDAMFYKQVVTQIQSKVFHSGARAVGVPPAQLQGTPFFLCGGGARMHFYARLTGSLKSFKGVSYLTTRSRRLQVPQDLVATGLDETDYDRLSVAYGLSRLEDPDVIQVQPLRKKPQPRRKKLPAFVSKDQV